MQMDFAFLLSCHARENELLAHLDVLKYCPVPHKIIVLYSGEKTLPVPFVPYSAQANLRAGAGFAFLAGMEEAIRHGLDAVCYRNGDDWLFRHELVAERVAFLKSFHVAGYSWFYGNATNEVALNELYVKVPSFRDADFAAWRDRLVDESVYPEYLAAEFLRVPFGFNRLSGREVPEGIGRALWRHSARQQPLVQSRLATNYLARLQAAVALLSATAAAYPVCGRPGAGAIFRCMGP